jgi:hypothetical protein
VDCAETLKALKQQRQERHERTLRQPEGYAAAATISVRGKHSASDLAGRCRQNIVTHRANDRGAFDTDSRSNSKSQSVWRISFGPVLVCSACRLFDWNVSSEIVFARNTRDRNFRGPKSIRSRYPFSRVSRFGVCAACFLLVTSEMVTVAAEGTGSTPVVYQTVDFGTERD